MKTALKLILLILGISLFGWFVHRAGPAEILETVSRLGWFAPLIVLPYFLVYLVDTLGWRIAFGSYSESTPAYGVLFRVRWAGEAVNLLVPSAYVGGEAVKAWLLHRRGVPGMTAGTSVVASKTCQTLAHALFIVLGSLAALPFLEAGSGARTGMHVVLGATTMIVIAVFVVQRMGLFSTATRIVAWLPFRVGALDRNREQLRKLDDQIYRFYHGDPVRFFGSTATYLCGWLCDSLEVYVVCWLLGHPIHFSEAIAIEAFISVAKVMGLFVPGALGVQESGVVFLFHLFGLPAPLGAAYAILRRAREVVYVSIGILLLYGEGATLFHLREEVGREEE